MVQSRPLFPFIFVFPMRHNLNSNLKWKKRRWCAWDLNPGWQDGRRERIHWATAAPLTDNVSAGAHCSVSRCGKIQIFNILKVFGFWVRIYSANGKIFYLVNGQKLKKDIAIWSHWCTFVHWKILYCNMLCLTSNWIYSMQLLPMYDCLLK